MPLQTELLDAAVAIADPPPDVSDRLPLGGESVWVPRAVGYAIAAVANAERWHEVAVERRLDRPSRGWTASEVARTYGASADGERRYREEAVVLSVHGYRPWLATAGRDDTHGGRVLVDGGSSSAAATFPRGAAPRVVAWVRGNE